MYTAIRCPRCLVTIYTVFSPGHNGFMVESLADESLIFYNCPFVLCEYHFDTNHNVNLYTNAQRYHRAYTSPGFTIAPLTGQTKPFRSPAQVADLAITVDIPQDEPRYPAVLGTQAVDEAQVQPAKIEQVGNGRGDAPVPAVTVPHLVRYHTNTHDWQIELTLKQNRSTRFMRWTPEEILELERLCDEGRGHDEIAKVCCPFQLPSMIINSTCPPGPSGSNISKCIV